jgi:outer membrane receptor for ferrienterochelin and colicins
MELSSQAYSENPPSVEEDAWKQNKNAITVTGTRRSKLLKDSVVKTEVISREDIDAMGARTVGDTLGNVPGIEVRPAEAGQRGETVRLQGLSAQNVLILVDGQRVTGRFNGGIDLTRFKVEDIERIEIIKGASSALYGSDAVAGVINIITREATHKYQSDFRSLYGTGRKLYYGSGGEFRNSGSIGMKEDSYSTQFTAGWHKGDGYDLTPDASPGPKNHRFQSQRLGYSPFPENFTNAQKVLTRRMGDSYSPPQETTTGNKFKDLNVTNKTIIKIGEDSNLTLNAFYRHLDQEGVDSAPPRRVFDRRNQTNDFMGAIGFDSKLNEKTNLNLNINMSRFEDRFTYDQRNSNELNKNESLLNNVFEFRSRLDFQQFSNHVLSLGLESLGEDIRSPRIQVDCARKFPNFCINDVYGLPPAQDSGFAKRQRNAVFLQDEWKVLGTNRFTLIPGLRYEDDSQFGNQTMPKLSFRFDISKDLLIRGSAGLGYRAPNFVELYYDFQNPGAGYRVTGNEALRPEISRSYNLGGEWEPINKIWFSWNFFYNNIDNLIGFKLSPNIDPNGLQVFKTSNFEKARTTGIETSLNYKISSRWTTGVGYTYTDSRDLTTNLPIESVVFHRGNVNLRYYNENFRAGFSIFGIIFGKQPFYCELDGLHCAPEAGTQASEIYLGIRRQEELNLFKSQIPLPIQKYCSENNIALCNDEPVFGYRMVNSYNNINLRIHKKLEENLELFAGVDNILEEFHITYNPQRPRFFYFGINGRFKSDKVMEN